MLALWNKNTHKSASVQTALRPDPVFVVGMHRSGTSALTGALESLGLTVGKTVMPPHAGQGNPKGFYENLPLTQLHDAFLKDIDSNWSHAGPISQKHFASRAARRFHTKLVPLLEEEFGFGRPLIKDPRMCRLMRLWEPVVKSHFPHAQFVLPIRHPVEVACSLNKRDQMPLWEAIKLWTVHVLEGERTTRGFKRVFISYDRLMQAPVETIDGLMKTLGLKARDAAISINERVDPNLRHHSAPPWPDGEPCEYLTLAIYNAMTSDDPNKATTLDRLREEYYDRMGWMEKRKSGGGWSLTVPARVSSI